jgi:cystathionine beta-lyase
MAIKTTAEFCKAFCVERRGTDALKWDSLGELFGDPNLTPLWVADMDFKTVPQVTRALTKRAEHGVFGYGRTADHYYEAFFSWQKKHHGIELRKEELRFGTGVVGSVYTLINAYTEPGDAVALCTPVYYPFSAAILNTGRKIAECELDNAGGIYTINLEKFEKTIRENRAKLFILCSPHNPVGRVWRPEELAGMFEICRAHKVMVVSDEIHQDFISPGHTFTPASVLEGGKYRDMLVTVNSGSKTFNLAGLTHSHTIIYDEKRRDIYDAYLKTIGRAEVNVLALIATEAAFRHGEEWLAGLNAVIQENYGYLKTRFSSAAPEIIVSPLEGTYLVWIDLRAAMDPAGTGDFIQKKCGLAVDLGQRFINRGGEGFIRINLATFPKYIKLAADRIARNIRGA